MTEFGLINRRNVLIGGTYLSAACSVDARGGAELDRTSELQSHIDQMAEKGGIVTFPPGIFRITAPLELRSGVSLSGSGRHYEYRADGNHFTGSWIRYDGPANQPAIRLRSIQHCSISSLGIDCGDRPHTTGIEIGSDNNPSCKSLSLRDLSIFGAALAVRWGLGNALTPLEQCDDTTIEDIGIYSCIDGFLLHGTNVSDYSRISRVSLDNLRGTAFTLKGPGFMTIAHCAAGALNDDCVMFQISGLSPAPVRIIGCQMEPKGRFLVIKGTNDEGQIILEANVINNDIDAFGVVRIESRANYFNSQVRLNGFVRWRSRDDVWAGLLNKPRHEPQVVASDDSQFVGSSLPDAVRFHGVHLPRGFRIERSSVEVMEEVIVREGIFCPAFTPGSHEAGAYVRPSRDNGKAYRVVRAGSAATEPDWTAAKIVSGSAEFEFIGPSAVSRQLGLLSPRA